MQRTTDTVDGPSEEQRGECEDDEAHRALYAGFAVMRNSDSSSIDASKTIAVAT